MLRTSKFRESFVSYFRCMKRRFSLQEKRKSLDLEAGNKLFGFKIEKIEYINEFKLNAVILRHEKTNAEYFHIQRNDTNNLFAVLFKTPPQNSQGTTHILEHMVLCGSKLYPVRDPFFKMLNRSLATFMNAMTGSDYTVYPFSSQNPTDFYNLMSVYLDAVFNPKLDELDFFQEGWRLEHENIDDLTSPLILKGVVFNEMKGVYADSQQIFAETIQNKLFPNTPYSYVSGGHPFEIPYLNWKDLCSFHATHYHPTNAKFFSYGNIPLESHLEFLDKNYLQNYDASNMNFNINLQEQWPKPQYAQINCRSDPLNSNTYQGITIAQSYMLLPITEVYENFILRILSVLLIDGLNSPFYKSLLESNLGNSFAPATGYCSETKQSSFTIGLQGVNSLNINKVSEVIFDTFKQIHHKGFKMQRIESVLHTLELQLKNEKPDFGLNLLLTIVPLWNNDGDVIKAISCDSLISQLRKDLKNNPRFFEDKIQKYFINNNHMLQLSMFMNENFEKEWQTNEENLIKNISNITDLEGKLIENKTKKLFEKQAIKENSDCLPMLHIKDIDKKIVKVSKLTQDVDGTKVHFVNQSTNGIIYFKIILNFSEVSDDVKHLIPLFCFVISKMGTKFKEFKDFEEFIDLKTGGLFIYPFISESPTNLLQYEEGLCLSSHCLNSNLPFMMNIWLEVFNDVIFENTSHLARLIKIINTNLTNEFPNIAHKYAIRHSACHYRKSCALKEEFEGLSQLKYMKKFSEIEDLTCIQEGLKTIAKTVLNKKHMRCAVTAEPNVLNSVLDHLSAFLKALPCNNKGMIYNFQKNRDLSNSNKFHFVVPFPINFIANSYTCVPFNNPEFSYLRIVSKLLSGKFLHQKIREQGGAYGCGVSASPDGIFSIFSYRDPNSLETHEIFNNALNWVIGDNFSEQDIEEAKIRVFQEEDKPVAIEMKGLEEFYYGLSDELRQTYRDHLFSATKHDLINATQNLLQCNKHNCSTIIGPSIENKTSEWNKIEI